MILECATCEEEATHVAVGISRIPGSDKVYAGNIWLCCPEHAESARDYSDTVTMKLCEGSIET